MCDQREVGRLVQNFDAGGSRLIQLQGFEFLGTVPVCTDQRSLLFADDEKVSLLGHTAFYRGPQLRSGSGGRVTAKLVENGLFSLEVTDERRLNQSFANILQVQSGRLSADLYGVALDRQELRTGALRWEMRHPGRTPRTAKQYIASLHLTDKQ